MAHMGYGYGSECHLLRWMGRHRRAFDSAVRQALGKSSGAVDWLDFHFAPGRDWPDAEWKGLDFITEDVVRDDWRTWWPQGRGIHNWDAVGWWGNPANREVVLMEAKAHPGELGSPWGATADDSRERIKRSLTKTAASLGITSIDRWMNDYYQLANRLAVVHFLRKHGYHPHLLLVYFVGDLIGAGRKPPQTVDGWKAPLADQKEKMGLPATHALSRFVHELYLPVSAGKAWLRPDSSTEIVL